MTADRLRALLAAYGPLKLHEQRDYAGMASLSRDIDPPPVMTMGRIVPGVGEFIVEAVNALPSLLDRLERAESRLRSSEADAERCQHNLTVAVDRLERAEAALTFDEFAATNRARCEAPDGFRHPLNGWSLSDWFLAATGEFGEAANKAKKLNRIRDGIPGNVETEDELRAGLADEIADAVIYLDLLAQSAGFALGAIVAAKFNRTSEKIGAPHRLAASEPPAGPETAEDLVAMGCPPGAARTIVEAMSDVYSGLHRFLPWPARLYWWTVRVLPVGNIPILRIRQYGAREWTAAYMRWKKAGYPE